LNSGDKNRQNDPSIFLPNLFVLGAAKCGTTSLHHYLSNMPECCMSEPKEPFYFECEYKKGLNFYQQKYFQHYRNEPFIGEARHRNLYLPYIPERLYATNPKARLLVILRNPTIRAFSHWWHSYSRGFEKLPFEKAIEQDLKRIGEGKNLDTEKEISAYCSVEDQVTFYRTYVDSGYYLQQIERYAQLFPRSQLKIVFTEDLHHDPVATIGSIRSFLGLPTSYTVPTVTLQANPMKQREAGTRTHRVARSTGLHHLLGPTIKGKLYRFYNRTFLRPPKLSKRMRLKLNRHFQGHNEALAKFVHRDLSHWNE
jgi:hypothetical protein